MPTTVADIIAVMDVIAPVKLAEEWDNAGLQLGDPRWPVASVMTALDPLPSVVEAAIREGFNMLITHHPLLLKPLRTIHLDNWRGKLIHDALTGRLAIFTAHTNFDSVGGGLNDILARRLRLNDVRPLIANTVLTGLAASPCLSTESVDVESPSGDVYGLGRLGRLGQPLSLKALALAAKSDLGLETVFVAGALDMTVDRVAVCTGSGSSLLPDFYSTDAQVFISGDLRYHDAREAELNGRALVDIGHFGSEHLMVENMARTLGEALHNRGLDVAVEAFVRESDPFVRL